MLNRQQKYDERYCSKAHNEMYRALIEASGGKHNIKHDEAIDAMFYLAINNVHTERPATWLKERLASLVRHMDDSE